MKRLIDADALKDWSETVPLTWDGGIDINDFEEKLKSMPTIDAIPIDFIEKKIDSIRQYLREHDGEEFMGGLISKAIACERLIEEWREEHAETD